ncbi:hypothetical protein [Deinococcus aestuarii]|uniref:hypothetical protein n=1 Tax=Deinococcus aestuarii TaxID=2774531 RepID=UPI001C0D96AC|nr:hypothetical protein [Deinococcus aestuarii]
MTATISLWSSLQGAERHAPSVESGEDLWLDRVKVDGDDFPEKVSPILSLL